MNRLAFVVRDGGYRKILALLTHVFPQARMSVDVGMPIVNWAVRAVIPKGASVREIQGSHANEPGWLQEKAAGKGSPMDISAFPKRSGGTSHLRLDASRYGADRFDVAADDPCPEAEVIADPDRFPSEKALHADHSPYF